MLSFSANRPALHLPPSTVLKPQTYSRRTVINLTGTFLLGRLTTPSNVCGKELTPDKEYDSFARELIGGIRGVIELELSGAEERAVRRKADPEKDRIKTFIRKWSSNSSISSTTSFMQISKALRELSQFYIKNGERAVLTKEVADRVLADLQSAEDSL